MSMKLNFSAECAGETLREEQVISFSGEEVVAVGLWGHPVEPAPAMIPLGPGTSAWWSLFCSPLNREIIAPTLSVCSTCDASCAAVAAKSLQLCPTLQGSHPKLPFLWAHTQPMCAVRGLQSPPRTAAPSSSLCASGLLLQAHVASSSSPALAPAFQPESPDLFRLSWTIELCYLVAEPYLLSKVCTPSCSSFLGILFFNPTMSYRLPLDLTLTPSLWLVFLIFF